MKTFFSSKIFVISALVALLLIFFSFAFIISEKPKYFPQGKNDQRPCVTVEYWGQLGNRLFQTAHAISFALDHNYQLKIPLSYARKDKSFSSIAKNLPFEKIPEVPFVVYEQKYPFSHAFIPEGSKNVLLKGFFESEKYFHKHKEVIKKLFAPSFGRKLILCWKYHDLFCHPKLVGIHVRTYCKDSEQSNFFQIFYAPDKQYFAKAISFFDPDSLFVVCSDNITWCKENLTGLAKNMVFIENSSRVNDFYLLTNCRGLILSNSTFSWWAAYLNPYHDKKVVVSVPWYKDPKRKTQDVLCKGWILVPKEAELSSSTFPTK